MQEFWYDVSLLCAPRQHAGLVVSWFFMTARLHDAERLILIIFKYCNADVQVSRAWSCMKYNAPTSEMLDFFFLGQKPALIKDFQGFE